MGGDEVVIRATVAYAHILRHGQLVLGPVSLILVSRVSMPSEGDCMLSSKSVVTRSLARSPFVGGSSVLIAVAVLLLVGACDTNQLGILQAEVMGDLTHSPAPRAHYNQDLVQRCPAHARVSAWPQDNDLLRLPYLQRTQHDSTMVLWVSNANEAEHVVVTKDDGQPVAEIAGRADTSATLPKGQQRWVQITGLEADTIYCYELRRAGRSVRERVGFKTAPSPGANSPVRFATMGDLGKESVDQFAVYDQLQTVGFDLAVINGDVAYESGTLAEFENNFFAVYAEMLSTVPFFVASGNHDYRTQSAQPYREVFALPENGGPEGRERWYSFDWGNVHFVALDTERIGSTQARWLDADLARNELPWVVVTGHRPAYSSGSHGSDSNMQRHFVPLFEKHGVQLVIAGHDHNYERTHAINGVTYIVTGAGGRGTRPVGTSSFTAFSLQVSHFVYVRIEGETLLMHAIDATGVEFDSLRLEHERDAGPIRL